MRIDRLRWLTIAVVLGIVVLVFVIVALLARSARFTEERDTSPERPALLEGRFTNSLGMQFVLIRPGTFLIGAAVAGLAAGRLTRGLKDQGGDVKTASAFLSKDWIS